MNHPRLSHLAVQLATCLCLWNLNPLIAKTPEGQELTASPAPVLLAEGGAAKVAITVSPDASEAVKNTAGELAAYLQRISGAEFAVVAGTAPGGITLGTLAQFPDPALEEPLAIREHYDGIEAFAIRTDANGVRLIANTELGVSHAAWRFLELLGCRWYFMTPTWEIVPEQPSLTFALNETSRPAIWSRSIWFDRLAQDPEARALFGGWVARNRLGHSLKVRILHRWHAIPGEMPALFDGHPEYLALVDGKRRGPQLCVTNPGLQAAIKAYAAKHFAEHPDSDMVSLDPADTSGWCTCETCAALGHHSNQPFHLANIVARELRTTHPGKFVGLLAYSWYSDPPSFDLEPNVYVQLTRGMNASTMSFDELFRLWAARSRNFGMYEYYSYWEMDEGMLPGSWVQETAELRARMEQYVTNRVRGISAQSANHWGLYGLSYYLAARLMWDASADVEALKQDFYTQAFGPAAPAMARYYERIHGTPRPLRGVSLLRASIDDVREAVTLAQGHPEILARLDDLRAYLVYCRLGELAAIAPKEQRRDAMLAWFTWAYRARQTHMYSWITYRSTVGRPAADEFGEPDWFWRNTVNKPKPQPDPLALNLEEKKPAPLNPWRDETPITPAELDERLAAIRGALGDPVDVAPREVVKDFALVDTGIGGAADRKQYFSTGMDFLLASVKGEPLRFMVAPRPSSIARPDAPYELKTESGEVVASGQLPVGEHQLELKVPGPGIYRFYCYSRHVGYRIVIPKEVPSAYVYKEGQRYRTSGFMSPLYFYVPKGLKEVAFYAYECGTIQVQNADGEVVHEAASDGSIVTIPVPPNQAGRVWTIGGHTTMRMRRFHFLNLPTVLSSNPDRVFVSQPAAEKDGLTLIVK